MKRRTLIENKYILNSTIKNILLKFRLFMIFFKIVFQKFNLLILLKKIKKYKFVQN